MNAEAFQRWMRAMGGIEKRRFGLSAAADALGISRNTVKRYHDNGAPKHIALACAALLAGLRA